MRNTTAEGFFILQESLTAQEAHEDLIEVLKYEGIFSRFLDFAAKVRRG